MDHRPIAILAIVCLALGSGGCASKSNRDYEEVLMPLQTGSVLHRKMLVRTGPKKSKTKKKPAAKPSSKPKEEAEPSPTPKPEEESTPAPERFR
jgi:hypothetical protein